jgi:hypothetical protein
MNVFAIAAGMMAVVHLVAGWQRPRLAVIVSGILWLLYAVYERLVATGVLCDADCNIRVDLVFFIPILGIATYCAYQSYMGDKATGRSSARFSAQSAWLFSRCWRRALVTALWPASR